MSGKFALGVLRIKSKKSISMLVKTGGNGKLIAPGLNQNHKSEGEGGKDAVSGR